MNKTRIWIILTLLIAVALAGRALAQTGSSFSVAINAPRTIVRLGSSFEIRAVLTNITTGSEWIYQDVSGEFDYTIRVLDQDKIEPSESRYFRAVKGKDSGKPTIVVNHGGGPRLVKPGGTITETIDLNKLYVLRPGKYSVQLERLDDKSKTVVQSNRITVTVAP